MRERGRYTHTMCTPADLHETRDESPAPGAGGRVEIGPGVFVPETALRFSFSRSSGPGGQNVNKLSTRARMHLSLAALAGVVRPDVIARLRENAGPSRVTDAGEIVITSDESRSQSMNRQSCLDRLRELIVQSLHAPKMRRATKPSRGAKRRRLEDKQRRSSIKRDRRGGFD